MLEQHLLEHRLTPGLVLLESTIAEAFRVSRAPVQMALRRLHEEGHIQRFEGRGYVVPRDHPAAALVPVRANPTLAGLDVSLTHERTEEIARGSWTRIAGETQRAIEAAVTLRPLPPQRDADGGAFQRQPHRGAGCARAHP